jgi:hypothetical protein
VENLGESKTRNLMERQLLNHSSALNYKVVTGCRGVLR